MKENYINLIVDSWIKNKYKKTFCIGGIIFSIAFCLFIFFFLNHNVKTITDNIEKKMGADFMIIPFGEKKQNEGILLSGNPASFYMKKNIEDTISKIEGVENTNSQIFVTTLAAGCCSFPVQAIGMDFEKDFTIKHWLYENNINVGYNEIVAGANLRILKGQEIVFFNTPYKVIGNLKPTGIGFDNSIFMTKQTAFDMIKKSGLKLEDEEPKNLISTILIKIDENATYDDVYLNIIRETKKMNVEIIKSKDFIKEFSSYLSQMLKMINILFCTLILLMTIVVFGIMRLDLKDKNKDLASLRIMGIAYKKMLEIYMKYILKVSFISTASGLIVGFLITNLFASSIIQKFGINFVEFSIIKQFVVALIIITTINMLVAIIQYRLINSEKKELIIRILRSDD